MANKIRIGILLDSYQIPLWSYKMLEQINDSSSCQIVLIVKNRSKKRENQSFLKKVLKNRKYLLFKIYSEIDKAIFKSKSDVFDERNILELLNVNTIEVEPQKFNFRDKILENDLFEIEKYKVDVFIRMGFRILSGGILNVAKYGVWSYHHGDNKLNRGTPAGVWEVLENWSETGVILQILTEDLDGGVILDKSFSATDFISPIRNRNNYYSKAISILPSKLNELYDLGEKEFFLKVTENNRLPQFYYNKLFKTPENKELLILCLNKMINVIGQKINNIFYFEQWILLFKINKSNSLSTSFYQFKKIIPPKDRFWADPHAIERNNKYYVFIEELLYSSGKGHISVLEMDKLGNYEKPIKVLERDYHLSYPFLIEDNGELYMIPETKQNRSIEIYKCKNFPLEWEFEMILIDNIDAVDSTIIFKDNKYWLFANVVRNQGASSCDELFLYYSDNLISNNWSPHPQNPIVSDVKQARPAGKLFEFKNNLFRPSQNCANRYGYGMKINQVIELSETKYKELQIDEIQPNWKKNVLGTHTLSYINNLTIIDALIKTRK